MKILSAVILIHILVSNILNAQDNKTQAVVETKVTGDAQVKPETTPKPEKPSKRKK